MKKEQIAPSAMMSAPPSLFVRMEDDCMLIKT